MPDYQKENLFVKTFEADSAAEIDKLVNKFRDENDVRFTTPLVNYIIEDQVQKKRFTYVVYYLPKTAVKKEEIIQKEDFKLCPSCNVQIPKSYRLHLKCGWREQNEKENQAN